MCYTGCMTTLFSILLTAFAMVLGAAALLLLLPRIVAHGIALAYLVTALFSLVLACRLLAKAERPK